MSDIFTTPVSSVTICALYISIIAPQNKTRLLKKTTDLCSAISPKQWMIFIPHSTDNAVSSYNIYSPKPILLRKTVCTVYQKLQHVKLQTMLPSSAGHKSGRLIDIE